MEEHVRRCSLALVPTKPADVRVLERRTVAPEAVGEVAGAERSAFGEQDSMLVVRK